MTSADGIKCASALVSIMEKEGIRYIFGHPGEQVLPLYEALRTSPIEHVLLRHEQGAVHAADGYARASANIGVCMASAGPGALNMVMGVAASFKDSIPLLVITGDVPRNLKGHNTFQDVDQAAVFQPITKHSFDVKNPQEAINSFIKAFELFNNHETGPIHINLPKDLLDDLVKPDFVTHRETPTHKPPSMQRVIKLLKNAKKPLIIAGAGIIWSKELKKFHDYVYTNRIPVATTYPARGIIPESNQLSIGLFGLRGAERAKYAGKNADIILALGCRLSERTKIGINADTPIIHVNPDENVLQGDINIPMDISQFLSLIKDVKINNTSLWLDKLKNLENHHHIQIDDSSPLKPQKAIKEILKSISKPIIVNDAGTHTTWVNLLAKLDEPSSLIFSGGFGPMGYGVPASVGVGLAKPERTIIVIVGDGGFQMTLQELATIKSLELPVIITIINNRGLGVIKQWQNLYYGGPYEVELENPDFVKLALAYGICAQRVNTTSQLSSALNNALKNRKPYLIEIIVDENEGIPLPNEL